MQNYTTKILQKQRQRQQQCVMEGHKQRRQQVVTMSRNSSSLVTQLNDKFHYQPEITSDVTPVHAIIHRGYLFQREEPKIHLSRDYFAISMAGNELSLTCNSCLSSLFTLNNTTQPNYLFLLSHLFQTPASNYEHKKGLYSNDMNWTRYFHNLAALESYQLSLGKKLHNFKG